MKQKFYKWLLRFSYRKLQHEITKLPDGIPGIRDIEAKCTGYSPRKLSFGEFAECEGDGHYLCRECCFYLKTGSNAQS